MGSRVIGDAGIAKAAVCVFLLTVLMLNVASLPSQSANRGCNATDVKLKSSVEQALIEVKQLDRKGSASLPVRLARTVMSKLKMWGSRP